MKFGAKEWIIGAVIALALIGGITALVLTQISGKKGYEDVVDTTASETISTTAAPDYDIDEVGFVKRAYELKYFLSINSFEKTSEISVNKITQYAMCHYFYNSMFDMPKDMKYCEAKPEEIMKVVKKHFNLDKINYTASDIYNKGDDKFEMWLPNYNTNVFYNYVTTEKGNTTYDISASYYRDASKSQTIGSVDFTVSKVKGGSYYISKLK